MAFLLERDTINGKEGKAFITIDGRNQELFSIKNLEAIASIQSEDMAVVGTTTIQSKNTGVKKTGTMTIYYGSPLFTSMVMQYMNLGKLPYFDMQVTNDDPTSTVGTQIIGLYGCKITGDIPIAKLDADTSMMEQAVSFTYTRAAELETFHDPEQLGS